MIILKGKGVFKQLPDGTLVRMSFPGPDSPHDEMSHFHIDHKTNKPHAEIPDDMRYWPKEAAARFYADELIAQGYPKEKALSFAKKVFNQATARFNAIKNKHGDDKNKLPRPFDENGQLHPAYMTNTYGTHEARRVPSSRRKTTNHRGDVINLHANNAPHPTAGRALESAAFHTHKEFQDINKELGFETQLGLRSNVLEPQHIIRAPGEDGKMRGLLRRYNSNERDPTHPDNTHAFPEHHREARRNQAFYGQISPFDILATVAQRHPRFFIPHTGAGRPPANVIEDLMAQGVGKQLANQMARAPIAQAMLGRGKQGSGTQFNNLLNSISNHLEIKQNPDVANLYLKHKGQFAKKIKGMDRGRTDGAIRLMAMLKTAQELDSDVNAALGSSPAPQSVIEGWNAFSVQQGGEPVDFEAMGIAEDHHTMSNRIDPDTAHYYDTIPHHIDMDDTAGAPGGALPPPDGGDGGAGGGPPLDQLTQQPSADDPFAAQGGSTGFRATGGFSPFPAFAPQFDPNQFKFSEDDPMGAIATIMERVQRHDTWENASIMKSVSRVNLNPKNAHDMRFLAKQVELEPADVRAIAMSIGDWDRVAKHFQVGRDVVDIIKASCVEVL